MRCRKAVGADGVAARVSASLAGEGERVQANGLGFDYCLLQASADASVVFVDPIVPIEYKVGTCHGRAPDLQLCAQASVWKR